MELLMALAIGVLFGGGLYLCLRQRTFQVVLGIVLLSHGANLLILNMGGIQRGNPPLLRDGFAQYTDPLVQALILTAIVISFGVTAFLLILAYRSYEENKTDGVNQDEND
jgi:multicomponent Na+:H+ antiporter subunit C